MTCNHSNLAIGHDKEYLGEGFNISTNYRLMCKNCKKVIIGIVEFDALEENEYFKNLEKYEHICLDSSLAVGE